MRSFPAVSLGSPGQGSPSATIPLTQVARDEAGNISANNFNQGFKTTVGSATADVLTAASEKFRIYTGSTAQTVNLPPVTSVPLGFSFFIVNDMAAVKVTVQTSGGTNVVILAGKTCAILTSKLVTGTAAASWQSNYIGVQISTGGRFVMSGAFIATVTVSQDAALTIPGSGGILGNICFSTSIADSGTNISFAVPLGLPGYTVATLPAGTVGMFAYVTNALAPAFGAPVTAGGAVVTPVFYDGTNWTCR